MESVFHRETLFSADRRPGQVFSSRPMSPLRYIGDLRRNTFKAPGEEGPQVNGEPSGPKVFADPAAGGLLSGPDVFTPIHCRLRNFF